MKTIFALTLILLLATPMFAQDLTPIEQWCADYQEFVEANPPSDEPTAWWLAGEAIYEEDAGAVELLEAAIANTPRGEIGYGSDEMAPAWAEWVYVSDFNDSLEESLWRLPLIEETPSYYAPGDRYISYVLRLLRARGEGRIGDVISITEEMQEDDGVFLEYDLSHWFILVYTWTEIDDLNEIARLYVTWHGLNPSVSPNSFAFWLAAECDLS